jgi:hypothetical protein
MEISITIPKEVIKNLIDLEGWELINEDEIGDKLEKAIQKKYGELGATDLQHEFKSEISELEETERERADDWRGYEYEEGRTPSLCEAFGVMYEHY